MKTQEISSQPKKTKYRYPGKTAEPFTNLDRAIAKYEIELHPVSERAPEVLRSDILEGRLADGSKVYVTFAWREATAQVLSLVIDWRMRTDLVVATLSRIPEQMKHYLKNVIWHTDQGSQYGSDAVIDELIRHNFLSSMSRAGTPTDNGAAERMVGEFKHAVLRRMSYQTIEQLLQQEEATWQTKLPVTKCICGKKRTRESSLYYRIYVLREMGAGQKPSPGVFAEKA